jgi:hypothetical protein
MILPSKLYFSLTISFHVYVHIYIYYYHLTRRELNPETIPQHITQTSNEQTEQIPISETHDRLFEVRDQLDQSSTVRKQPVNAKIRKENSRTNASGQIQHKSSVKR